ncbi:MAG: hemerythrin domain-containing protein [Planctomycetes bacterium]|nr:hemerythrin domain-containing protein [Planctomycetota bacterium]
MRPTETLNAEHRVIEVVLSCLDKMADSAFTSGAVDVAPAREAVDFLRNYADAFHHGKEEARLFPAMERCGMPADAGPTAVMRHEHELGRAHVRKMAVAIDDFEKGASGSSDRFAFEARGFVELLRDHIAKEDQVLFPMADRMLSPAAQIELKSEFDHVETHEVGPGTRTRYEAVAQSLAGRFGITPEAVRACSHVCGCAPGPKD